MSAIDGVSARSFALPRAPLPQVPLSDSDESSTPVRTPALMKTAAMRALEDSDDMSALRSSLRRTRSAEADGGDVRDTAWLDHVLEPKGPEKLSAVKLQLRTLPSRDAATLRALITGLFPDPSDAVAVLKLLLSDAELEDIRSELAELHEQLRSGGSDGGASVRAGVNVALKARVYAQPLKASAIQLRQSYRDFIGAADALDSYASWLELYGFERRHRVLDFIENALAADMYSLDPSCSHLEFGALLQRVRQLTTLRSADHLMMSHCWDPILMPRIGIDPETLLSALMTMMRHRGGIGQLLVEVFNRAQRVLALPEKRCLAQGMRRFLKALPHGLWGDVGLQQEAEDDVDALLERALAHERTATSGADWVPV